MNNQLHKNKIYQNDIRLDRHIQATGCFFRSLCGIAETYTNQLLTPTSINRIYNACIERHSIMTPDCWMGIDRYRVIEIAGKQLGYDIYASEIGRIEREHTYLYSDRMTGWYAAVLCVKTKWGSHFSECDASLNEVFDPWNPNIIGMIQRYYLFDVGYR